MPSGDGERPLLAGNARGAVCWEPATAIGAISPAYSSGVVAAAVTAAVAVAVAVAVADDVGSAPQCDCVGEGAGLPSGLDGGASAGWIRPAVMRLYAAVCDCMRHAAAVPGAVAGLLLLSTLLRQAL